MTEIQEAKMRIRKAPKKRGKRIPELIPAPVGRRGGPEVAEEIDVFASPTDFELPAVRPLKAYAFDPSEGRYLGNEMTRERPLRASGARPDRRRIAVDRLRRRRQDLFYKPVDLDDPNVLIRGGVPPSESDPRFHQQMVYAVASDTIQHFESALGRRIHWRLDERVADEDGQIPRGPSRETSTRLNLFPHAMVAANAVLQPRRARASCSATSAPAQTNPGHNLPGQTVFTCLSHDIIVHETTHAILDGIRSYFPEPTNADVPAFHEAFADLVALFRHFSHKEALLDTIQKTGGRLYQYQPASPRCQPARAATPTKSASRREIGNEQSADRAGAAVRRGTGQRTGPAQSALGTRHDSDRDQGCQSRAARSRRDPRRRGVRRVLHRLHARDRRPLPHLPRRRRQRQSRGPARAAGRTCWRTRRAGRRSSSSRSACAPSTTARRSTSPSATTCAPSSPRIATSIRPTRLGVRDAFMQAFRLRGIVAGGAPLLLGGRASLAERGAENAAAGRRPGVRRSERT